MEETVDISFECQMKYDFILEPGNPHYKKNPCDGKGVVKGVTVRSLAAHRAHYAPLQVGGKPRAVTCPKCGSNLTWFSGKFQEIGGAS